MGSGTDGARVTASRTLRLPHVAEYLRRQMLDAFRLEAPRALATLRRLHTLGASEYVQYHAAASLLDRAGYRQLDQPIQQEALIVNINIRDHKASRPGDEDLAQVLPPSSEGDPLSSEVGAGKLSELAHVAEVLDLD